MKAFVTGGTGLIGRHVARKLLARGYEVVGLTRRREGAAWLEGVGAKAVLGDVGDRESMREAMQSSDVVFHMAGIYSLRGRDRLCGGVAHSFDADHRQGDQAGIGVRAVLRDDQRSTIGGVVLIQ